ncbi:MAG: tryptophan-rich sensory protein, partial [Anaerolineales bacterium]
YAVFQVFPAQTENPRMENTGWWVVLGCLVNSMWIFLWHYELFIGTLAAMLILLASLIAIYLRLGIGETKASSTETWMVRIPFSIYLGWITVATIANVTDVLSYLKWNQFGHSDGTWMLVILSVVVVIAGLMSFTRRDIAYTAVILWALAGIGVKFPQQGMVTIGIWIAFGLVVLILGTAMLLKRKTVQG